MSDHQLIQEKRDAAERARRLMLGLPQSEDRERLLAYARELDAEADELERQMAAAEKTRQPVTGARAPIQAKSGKGGDEPKS